MRGKNNVSLWFASGAADRIFVYVFHCGIEKGDLTPSNGFGPPSISMNRTAYSNTTNEGGKVSEISYLCVYSYRKIKRLTSD
jgi:hypothetical protein